MVTPAERGLESPTVGRACTLVQAERDAAATQVEKSMDEEKSMEGGGCRPQPQSAPGESAVTPGSGPFWPVPRGRGSPESARPPATG